MKNTIFAVLGFAAMTVVSWADERPTRGNAAKGQTLFAQCAGCHNTETDEKKVGPSLKKLFKHSRLHNGKAVSEANVRTQLSNGSKGMPAFGDDLPEREIDDILAYLKTL